MKTTKTFVLLLLIALRQIAFGQTNQEKALKKGQEAIKLEDEGKYAEALKLLAEAQKLDPGDFNYPYETGYTYYLQKDYKRAIDEFKKVVKYKNITDQCFQML